MGVITPAQLAFNGKQIQTLSEAIMTAFYENPKITDLLTITTGVKAKQQIAVIGFLGLVGRTNTGCEPATNPGQITMSEKSWNPVYVEDRFRQCWKELLNTFFLFGLKNGVKKADLRDTDFALMLEQRISEAMAEAVHRIAFFGDLTHSPVGDGAGNGLLKVGTDKVYFNMLNGIWSQIFAIVAGDATKKIAIPNNAGVSYAAQLFTGADVTNQVITNVLLNMVTSSDYRLRASSDKVLMVTQSVADQYKAERRQAGAYVGEAYGITDKGVSQLMFDGIPMVIDSNWDRTIRTYFDNGVKWHLPHRIILGVKSNMQLATEEESNLSELEPNYLIKEKEYIVDFGFNIDAKVIENQLIEVAY